jgi:hypothetical protein
MAISAIVVRGYGSFGSVNLVVTRGYTSGAPPAIPLRPRSMRSSLRSGSALNGIRAGRATSEVET